MRRDGHVSVAKDGSTVKKTTVKAKAKGKAKGKAKRR